MTQKHSRPPVPIVARCHCGAPGLITVGLRAPSTTWGDVTRTAYCLDHLGDALTAIDQIRRELVAADSPADLIYRRLAIVDAYRDET